MLSCYYACNGWLWVLLCEHAAVNWRQQADISSNNHHINALLLQKHIIGRVKLTVSQSCFISLETEPKGQQVWWGKLAKPLIDMENQTACHKICCRKTDSQQTSINSIKRHTNKLFKCAKKKRQSDLMYVKIKFGTRVCWVD